MTVSQESERTKRLVLAGDGCLITAGAFAVLMGISFGIDFGTGAEPAGGGPGGPVGAVISGVAWFIGIAGFGVGPLLAWLLSGRRLDRISIVAGVAGYPIGAAVVGVFSTLIMGASALSKALFGSQIVGPVVILAIIAVGFVALAVWLLALGTRDMRGAREHIALDVARIFSTVAAIIFVAATLWYAFTHPGSDPDASIFMLLAALMGGSVVTVADTVGRWLSQRMVHPVDAATPTG